MTNLNINQALDKQDYLEKRKEQWDKVYDGDKEKLPWTENPIPVEIISKFCSFFSEGGEVLDFGCGDGILTKILIENGLSVTCSDISAGALKMVSKQFPNIKTIQAGDPSEIITDIKFDGILVWGVLHHVDERLWDEYFKRLSEMTKPNGYILFGGHSKMDSEFSEGYRISPTTGEHSTAIDSLENTLLNNDVEVIDSGYFPFKEAFTSHQRAFRYFLIKN
jgi:2-polyprenyl-3-methyl-5-hydroxy-6-metoxy-1,4-benzoquinol methylase